MTTTGLFGAFDVRLDPWDAEYSGELPLEAGVPEAAEDVDLAVEHQPDAWTPVIPVAAQLPSTIIFIDGVRRVEARLVVRRDERLIHGVIGSYGVGAVRIVGGRAACGQEEIGRIAALGSGECLPSSLDLGAALTYQPSSSPRDDADGPPLVVFEAMRAAEAQLARACAAEAATLVVADGPLTFGEASRGQALGFVKRFFKIYVGNGQFRTLANLPVGARSPLFHIRGGARFGRFSWFVRLAPRLSIDGDITGLARLEIADVVGFETARSLADAVTVVLPRFVPSRGRDPRAPQNLLPIGALEARLRHQLGDTRLIRRRLADLISRETTRV
jgi:hypothetical protein